MHTSDDRVETDERFRLAVEACPNAMVMSDHEAKIILVNSRAERLFGYRREELLGQPIEILLAEASRKGHLDLRQNFLVDALARPMGIGRDLHAQRKDGTQFPVEIGLNPIKTAKGTWVLSSIVNLTFDRQKLESVGVLAGGIAHDFNNFLGSILSDADLALEELSSGSPPVEEIRRIKTVAIRASEIVRQLMIYAVQENAHRELVDVSWLMEEMAELIKVSISKYGSLKMDLSKNLPLVLGNRAQIRQVVMNLIINASEALKGKGVIRVATSQVTGGRNLAPDSPTELREGSYIRLSISDTGRGLTEEERARIFDPFFSTKFAGRGLGLAVVQSIVRAHGGAIDVVSAPGHGTTFHIFLPCAEGAEERERSTLSANLQELPHPTSATVLLVEDEETLRVSVSKILRRNRFSVIEAGNGSVAIEYLQARTSNIDVVLLDLTIPGASSLEVIEEARRSRGEIKVVLMSAYSLDMAPLPSAVPQLNGFIRKPFELVDLVQLLRDVLSKARTASV
jgi:two-component system cell cycle sensor histidine kinase/response regulator CckA